ncbi:MAG TPA: ABC transporter ATP-binding protein [Anaerolineales bacterium]|nr:ABC transporter ATP-binding protein [Anaerolineales bacterium]
MRAILQARKLFKRYGTGEAAVDALRGVDLAVAPGEFVAIMGPSGSGKSTLLHLLGGLDAASGGESLLGEVGLSNLPDADLTRLRRRSIGVVFQFFNLLPTMTAAENVGLPLALDGIAPGEVSARAAGALAWVGLSGRADHTPDRLSGGEQQRVALARALVFEPKVILADEPTGNLDRAAGEQVLGLLRRACDERGQTVVMVTHDDAAAAHADRVVFLLDGQIADELAGPDLSPEAVARARSRLQA